MKRPKFLTIWLVVMFILSVGMTIDSLTYIPFILLSKSYISFVWIVAGFVQIWALIQLLKWKKVGVTLYIFSAVVVFLTTAVNEFKIVSNVAQIIVSLSFVLVLNIIMLGVLYLAIRPVWKDFKY